MMPLVLRAAVSAGLTFAAVLLFGQTEPTFRAGVSLIHVDAAVYLQDERILQGLIREDFRIFDNGQEQKILGFSVAEVPLDLVLLFDASGSMRPQVQKVAATADMALHELKLGDRVSVMAFNRETFMQTPFATDRQAIDLDVQDLLHQRFGGGTRIQEAVDDAAKRLFLEARTDHRRAILIITDDLSLPTRREPAILRDLWEADAVLSGLLVKPGMLSRRPWHPVENLAEKSGGETLHTEDSGADFPKLVQRLRTRYDLYYAPPGAAKGSFREIRVELSPQAQQRHPGAHVHARRGYRVSTK